MVSLSIDKRLDLTAASRHGDREKARVGISTIYGGLVGSSGIHVSTSTWQISLFFLVSKCASLTLGKFWGCVMMYDL